MESHSAAGITHLMKWAKSTGAILNEGHERVADCYGIDTTGVKFARQIPIEKNVEIETIRDEIVRYRYEAYYRGKSNLELLHQACRAAGHVVKRGR